MSDEKPKKDDDTLFTVIRGEKLEVLTFTKDGLITFLKEKGINVLHAEYKKINELTSFAEEKGIVFIRKQ